MNFNLRNGMMSADFATDVAAVAGVSAVPTILEVVCAVTGMGFATVARVTPDRWVACGVRDGIAFGLRPGDELKAETTICSEIRRSKAAVIINHVAEDSIYRGHPAAAIYGFESYISVPIILPDGSFFGTLCAFDPRPARLSAPETVNLFKLFADLIAFHLDANARLACSEATLSTERKTAELREQFIAILGHDLRNPLAAISGSTELLQRAPLDDRSSRLVSLIHKSVARMAGLIDDVMDFARGRLGGGLTLKRDADEPLAAVLWQVIGELQARFPDRAIEAKIRLDDPINCDRTRIAQLLSNLLANALTHGAAEAPVRVDAATHATVFELSVANAGDPILAEAQKHLFQPFTRGLVRPGQQGLGLGLFIASEVAKGHGGTLEVVSSGEETRFTFRMPLG